MINTFQVKKAFDYVQANGMDPLGHIQYAHELVWFANYTQDNAKYDEAIRHYNFALEIVTNNIDKAHLSKDIHFHIGQGLFNMGRYSAAMSAADTASALGASSMEVQPLYNMAQLQLSARKNQDYKGTEKTVHDYCAPKYEAITYFQPVPERIQIRPIVTLKPKKKNHGFFSQLNRERKKIQWEGQGSINDKGDVTFDVGIHRPRRG